MRGRHSESRLVVLRFAFETCEASRHHQVRTWRRQRAPPPSTGKIQDPPRHEQARAVVRHPRRATNACARSLPYISTPGDSTTGRTGQRSLSTLVGTPASRLPLSCIPVPAPDEPEQPNTPETTPSHRHQPAPPRGLCTGAPAIHKGSGMVGCFVGVQPRRLGNRLIPHLP